MTRVYAQVSNQLVNPVPDFESVGQIFGWIINLLIGIGWAMVFVMLALGFIQYVMSKGEKAAVDSAQKWLTYAVIGGVGLFFISFLKTVIPDLLQTGAQEAVDEATGGIINFGGEGGPKGGAKP